MKIVQTLWLPHSENPLTQKCGWASPEFHWMSWTLSVLQLREYYDEVELYANEAASEVLINKLKLPYTKVTITDEASRFPASAWAMAKINSYEKQEEPFLHVDGDVYIFKPFDQKLLAAPLIAQSIEVDLFHYRDTIKDIIHNFSYIPDIVERSINESQLTTFNAGILGGSDLPFIKAYCNLAKSFVNKNLNHFTNITNTTPYCMFFEQFLFSVMVKE